MHRQHLSANIVFALLALLCSAGVRAELRFGVASVDITPDYPVRLNGYAARTNVSEGVEAPIFAKALALEFDNAKPALLLTIDTCAITEDFRSEIAYALQQRFEVAPERLVLSVSHTHYAPALKRAIPNMFAAPISAADQATIDRYTRELVGKVLSVAASALTNLQQGSLYFGQGKAGFAKNRRTEGGPVDHSLPLLLLKDKGGTNRAVLANYACHCTSFSGNLNKIHPDWAGVARTVLEVNNPGLTALISIGCGADSNPYPRGELKHGETYGRELATELQRLLSTDLKRIEAPLQCHATPIDLAFDPLPTRQDWEERAAQRGAIGYHARRNLDRLARGESIPTTLSYYVQTWTFGSELAMVFLAGEVVVDYSLRLKSLYDPERLWVSGYSNWVPCYIPSRRILREGGYEAESSLWYYDRPTRLAPETEDRIISAVEALLPKSFSKGE